MVRLKASRVISVHNFLNMVHVLVKVTNVKGAIDDSIVEGFGDLRLATTGDRARLVAVRALRRAANESVCGSLGVLLERDLIT